MDRLSSDTATRFDDSLRAFVQRVANKPDYALPLVRYEQRPHLTAAERARVVEARERYLETFDDLASEFAEADRLALDPAMDLPRSRGDIEGDLRAALHVWARDSGLADSL